MSERKLTEWAWSYIKNFRTYVDIGASTGKTSVPFIDKFEKIYCFEPNPESFEILSQNKKLICFNVALGDKEETKNLIINNETNNPEHGSIAQERNQNWINGKSFSVQVKRLDDYKIENIDFIKIDTEQYEMQVILGSLKTIKKNRPTIFFENKRNEADSVILLLLDLGYTVKKWKSDTIAYYTE